MKKVILAVVTIILLCGMLITLTGCETQDGSGETGKRGVSQETRQYNDPFTRYEGEGQPGSYAKSVCEAAITHNHTYEGTPSKQIALEFGETTTTKVSEIRSIKTKIVNGQSYSISFKYDKAGYITTVIIK